MEDSTNEKVKQEKAKKEILCKCFLVSMFIYPYV